MPLRSGLSLSATARRARQRAPQFGSEPLPASPGAVRNLLACPYSLLAGILWDGRSIFTPHTSLPVMVNCQGPLKFLYLVKVDADRADLSTRPIRPMCCRPTMQGLFSLHWTTSTLGPDSPSAAQICFSSIPFTTNLANRCRIVDQCLIEIEH